MPSIQLSKKALLAQIKSKGDDWLKDRISFMGTDLEGIKGDEIQVEIFPNRPDQLSQQGFTRALKSFVGQTRKAPRYETTKGKEKVIVEKAVAKVRPYTACAIVRGLTLGDQEIKDIIQMQEKLHITYGRNRKRCAIGIYPMEHISLPITYTARKPGDIKFEPLEGGRVMTGAQILSSHPTGRDYGKLLEGESVYPIFVDAVGEILSMPPIINSEKTGRVTSKTTEVFVECSGHSYHVVHGALSMMVTALADMGGKIEEMTLEYPDKKVRSPNMQGWKLPFTKEYVWKYIGYQLSEKDIISCLLKMGIACEARSKDLVATIPAYRVDVLHPIDLIEDIAIGYGLENVEAVIPRVATIASEDPLEAYCNKIREILSGHGLIEIKNYNITNGWKQGKKAVVVASAASSEYDTLRTRMIPSGLLTLQRNRQHEYPQNVFEIGDVFEQNAKEETGVGEGKMLSVLLCGENADYTKVRQILDSLMAALDLKVAVKVGSDDLLMPGRTGTVIVGKKNLGVIGEVDPSILSELELEMPVAAFEISLVDI